MATLRFEQSISLNNIALARENHHDTLRDQLTDGVRSLFRRNGRSSGQRDHLGFTRRLL